MNFHCISDILRQTAVYTEDVLEYLMNIAYFGTVFEKNRGDKGCDLSLVIQIEMHNNCPSKDFGWIILSHSLRISFIYDHMHSVLSLHFI